MVEFVVCYYFLFLFYFHSNSLLFSFFFWLICFHLALNVFVSMLSIVLFCYSYSYCGFFCYWWVIFYGLHILNLNLKKCVFIVFECERSVRLIVHAFVSIRWSARTAVVFRRAWSGVMSVFWTLWQWAIAGIAWVTTLVWLWAWTRARVTAATTALWFRFGQVTIAANSESKSIKFRKAIGNSWDCRN